MSDPKPGFRRISIDVPEDLYIRFVAQAPWGHRGTVIKLMISDFVDLMEEHGAGKVLGAFMERAVTMRDITKVNINKEKGNE